MVYYRPGRCRGRERRKCHHPSPPALLLSQTQEANLLTQSFPKTLRASATQGLGAVEGAAYDVSLYSAATFYLSCTVHSGTAPTLDVLIEAYDPASSTWYTLVTFTQSTAAVTGEVKYVGDGAGTTLLPATIRVKSTIGGSATPVKTFSVGAVLRR